MRIYLITWGVRCMIWKRFKEAAEAYGEGIKAFPNDGKLYYGRGLARNQSGDKNGACEDWHRSSELGCLQANALLPVVW